MHMALFMAWTFGFWPMIVGVEYAWTHVLGYMPLFYNADDQIFILALFVVWIIGLVQTYRLLRWKQGLHYREEVNYWGEMEEEDWELEPNTLVIVEAPNEQQFVAVNARYIESEAYFSSLPEKGKRLVLSSGDAIEPTILGVIDDAAEGAYPLAEVGRKFFIWIRLDTPGDYEKLHNTPGWDVGSDNKCRSTITSYPSVQQVAPA